MAKGVHAAATARWEEDFGIQAQVVAREAAKADVTLLSHALHRRAEGGPSAVTAALFEAHATVLVIPVLSVGKLGAHVAIAWKASEPARRAIQAALPVLRPAQHVTILIGTDEGETPPPDDVIAAITAGGPAPALHYFRCEGETTGNALLREAAKIGADLLVMGAYSHPRVLEFLLGGATRDVLHAATIPVLMHH